MSGADRKGGARRTSPKNSALRLCVAAMLCALSFAVMYLGTLIGVGDL